MVLGNIPSMNVHCQRRPKPRRLTTLSFLTIERRTQFVGIGFVTPTFLIIALILVYPVIQSIVLSLGQSSMDGYEPYQFVGLEHYAALMSD